MDNIQFEISHEYVVALLAELLGVESGQITLRLKDECGNGAIIAAAVVRTDLSTAKKIDRKLKNLVVELDTQEVDTGNTQVRHG